MNRRNFLALPFVAVIARAFERVPIVSGAGTYDAASFFHPLPPFPGRGETYSNLLSPGIAITPDAIDRMWRQLKRDMDATEVYKARVERNRKLFGA